MRKRNHNEKYLSVLQALASHGRLNLAQIMLYSGVSHEGVKEILDQMITREQVIKYFSSYKITAIGIEELGNHQMAYYAHLDNICCTFHMKYIID